MLRCAGLGSDLWRNSNTKTSVAGVLATHSHFSDFSRPAHPTTAAAHDDAASHPRLRALVPVPSPHAATTPRSDTSTSQPTMAAATTAPGSVAEQFSLLPKLMPNLDRHLLFPLLNFSSDEEAEQTPEQRKLLLALLSPTNMTDFVGQLYQDVHGLSEMPAEFTAKREQVLSKRDELEAATAKISELLDDENVVTNLRSDKAQNLQYLKESHGVTLDDVNRLYEFGQFQYSCGVYPHAAELLYRFRVLVRCITLPRNMC